MKEKDFQKYWHSSIRGKFSNDLLGEVIFEFLHWHISNQSKYDQTNFHILCVTGSVTKISSQSSHWEGKIPSHLHVHMHMHVNGIPRKRAHASEYVCTCA